MMTVKEKTFRMAGALLEVRMLRERLDDDSRFGQISSVYTEIAYNEWARGSEPERPLRGGSDDR